MQLIQVRLLCWCGRNADKGGETHPNLFLIEQMLAELNADGKARDSRLCASLADDK